MSERKSIHDGWTPEPLDEVQQNDNAIKEAFERVRLAREDLMKRRGRKYKQSVPERNWKSPVKDD